MIQPAPALTSTLPSIRQPARIWGLSAADVHEGFWRSRGIQCIRRGQTVSLQAGADLYLLIEPDQLVWFDVHEMAERLAWRAAAVTRLRVIGQDEEAYGEHVVIDKENRVKRITRRYRPQTHASYRVLLTRRSRFAKIWMGGGDRRSLWRKIRRAAGDSHIDAWRAHGQCLSLNAAGDDVRFIDHLVQVWERPDRVIEGVVEAGDGVWMPQSQIIDRGSLMIGPAWIGSGTVLNYNRCLVGPTWLPDNDVAANEPANRLREIIEIEPAQDERDVAAPSKTRRGYAFAKRFLDIAVSGGGLLLMLPVMVAIALCVLIEGGWPMLYRQRRQSRGGRVFSCWKFRTMCREADAMKGDIAKDNVCDGPQFYVQNDPRVTRVGRVLRRSYLDELPQLWNVLVGDMSLVGPRPSPDSENQICPAWRELRLSVRPGVTGLWQLERTRKPGQDFQEWIRYDLEYLERASFWFDLQLLARTALAVLKR
jgi:lipopolysaccharide/colanic/teichoic acid biosynthesis glycosyltransferase